MESAFHQATFPGGVTVSQCSVYETVAADELRGGSPHVHFTCSEGYVVLGGAGRLQTLSAAGFRETALRPLDVVWFEPGVIHRLVNDDGSLRLLVVMQNGGLPEAGDAVFAFPLEIVADPDRYAVAAAAADESAVWTRRDLAVAGFCELCADPSLLDAFYAAAIRLVRAHLDDWEERWRKGAAAAAQQTHDLIGELRRCDISSLRGARTFTTRADDASPRLGMCGRLATVDWDAVA